MFIDYRYTCWSGLDLDKIDFSGIDFTHAWFKQSKHLNQARYCCFKNIKHEGLNCDTADLKGTLPSRKDKQSTQRLIQYFGGLTNLLQASQEVGGLERHEELQKASQLLASNKKAPYYNTWLFKMHQATIALHRKKSRQALNLLFTAWNLNTDALNTILNPKPDNPPHYLNLLGWDAFKEKLKEVITQQKLREFYIQLSEVPLDKNHTKKRSS